MTSIHPRLRRGRQSARVASRAVRRRRRRHLPAKIADTLHCEFTGLYKARLAPKDRGEALAERGGTIAYGAASSRNAMSGRQWRYGHDRLFDN